MASSETVTSTSNTVGGEYQVFLSFRGPDTRLPFTNILHQALVDAGIRVFIDDVGLQPGEKISNLLQVIDNCKLYIPIFSKDYASSHWCLDELAKMVENTSKHKEDGKEKVILPIFYDVKPKDVKLQTPLYKDVISNLEQEMEDQEHKFSSENIKTWRESLVEVGGIKGWEVEKHSSPPKLIQAIVDEVVAKLKTKRRRVTRDFVGMEDQIANIKKLLDIDSGDVRFIGIYGMGGIGKTTLAKTIFNELCPQFGRNCSFLDDVRETAKSKNIVELQKKLLSDISYSRVAHKFDNIDEGIDTIEATICNKKMLIVLDDVDEANQILQLIGEKSLHQGSRILVTTRNKNVLTSRKFKYEFKDYEMMGLEGEDALKLFSRHAFNDDSPPADYYTLSKRIVYTTHGLPLALQAIGSSLFRKKSEIWEEWLERLKKTPHNDVLAKLKISYDALDQNEKQIFLDIACYFAGENKTDPMYVWKDCNLYPEDAMDVLINRCMIKELDNNSLWMHDQFRDLGRKIAREERIGLWDKDDIIRELRSAEIKESIQALNFPWGYCHGAIVTSVTSKQIKRFPRLRFLFSNEVIYRGDFTGCLSELKWIRLYYSSRNERLGATNLLHLENVVVANLYGIEITKDLLDSLIKGARKLKVLTIEDSSSMSGTLTFSECSNLEKLKFSIFAVLMESDRWLRDFRHTSFDGWDHLIKLLGSVSKLKLLTKLDVDWIPIPKMPDMTGTFHLTHELDLDYCHEMQEWPKLPISLTTLRVESILLLTIPNLSYLTNLVELVLSNHSEFSNASNVIQTCDLRWIGMLSKLRKLYLRFPNVRNVCAPTTQLDSLSLLKELTVHGKGLPAFKQLPPNLIDLELYETRGKQVHFRVLSPSEMKTIFLSTSSGKSRESKVYQQPDVQFLDVLESSERSRIQDCKSSERLVCLPGEPGCSEPQAPELTDHGREVFLFPSSQKMLVKFILSGFAEVQDIQFVTAFESLEEFCVKDCFSLKSLGGLSNSKNLKLLEIGHCPSLKVVEGIDELEFLGDLRIKYCGKVGRILDPLSSKIPDNCSIAIIDSGEFPNCGSSPLGYRPDRWKSYREKILNGAKQAWRTETETGDFLQNLNGANQAWNSETETTDSETETGDSL